MQKVHTHLNLYTLVTWTVTTEAHYKSWNCTNVMFLAGSWFQWGPPNLPEVSSVSCLCSCSRTFYFTVTPLVILPTIPAPGDLCHFWHVSWLLLLIKQEEILSYFLTFWNYVKFDLHNELLLVHSYPSSLTCFQRLVLHFSGRAE